MSAMMEILKQIQRDLAEQKDYMRNLYVIHKNINEKFNLMENKIDQQRAVIEMLEQQVRKNNLLLFGNDDAGIDFEDKTNLNNKEQTRHLTEQSDKYTENTEDGHNAFKIVNVVEYNPESNPAERVKKESDKNKKGEFTPKEVREIKEANNQVEMSPAYFIVDQIKDLIRDYIATTKSSDKEDSSQIRKQETVQISPTYFSTDQLNKLNEELKRIAEKYQSTNIFPVINVTPGPLVNSHPILVDLSKSVYYRDIYGNSSAYPPYKVNLGSTGFKRSEILEMIIENPNVTLYDVVMEGLNKRNEVNKCHHYDFDTPFVGSLPPRH